MKHLCWLVATLLWLWTAQANAGVVVPIPDAKLEASADGKAVLKAAGGVRFAVGGLSDLTVRASAETETNAGVVTLLSFDGTKGSISLPWSLGLNASLFQFVDRKYTSNSDDLKRAAWNVCLRRCEQAKENPGDPVYDEDRKGFCNNAGKDPKNLDDPLRPSIEDFCQDGKYAYTHSSGGLPDTAIRAPAAIVNGGLKLGQTSFSFLQPSATDATQLSSQKDTPLSFSLGFSGIWLPLDARTHGNQ